MVDDTHAIPQGSMAYGMATTVEPSGKVKDRRVWRSGSTSSTSRAIAMRSVPIRRRMKPKAPRPRMPSSFSCGDRNRSETLFSLRPPIARWTLRQDLTRLALQYLVGPIRGARGLALFTTGGLGAMASCGRVSRREPGLGPPDGSHVRWSPRHCHVAGRYPKSRPSMVCSKSDEIAMPWGEVIEVSAA